MFYSPVSIELLTLFFIGSHFAFLRYFLLLWPDKIYVEFMLHKHLLHSRKREAKTNLFASIVVGSLSFRWTIYLVGLNGPYYILAIFSLSFQTFTYHWCQQHTHNVVACIVVSDWRPIQLTAVFNTEYSCSPINHSHHCNGTEVDRKVITAVFTHFFVFMCTMHMHRELCTQNLFLHVCLDHYTMNYYCRVNYMRRNKKKSINILCIIASAEIFFFSSF